MSRSRNRNRPTTPPQPQPTPTALAEVIRVKVFELGPQHIGCRIEVTDRYDGMVGPAGGTLVGYRPAPTPKGYNEGPMWRQLLIAQGPGKGEAPTVREVDTVKLVT
jgi:hypothetical protein